ncbi:MAG: bifunctional demethylmenaquinone methyltransferase/2-methoxy-6-polyprenyl-1,4-benzoquinol methylase UbiE [Myxococcaceae bacterium]
MSDDVRQMFASIAPRYDLANEVLSFGIHRFWRRATVSAAALRKGAKVLDCATGTGDLALALKRAVGPKGVVVGTDFCAEMLSKSPQKAKDARLDVRFEVADVMSLPYEDGAYDAATIAFGIRNVDDPRRGISEMARVTRPGGRVVVLEFGQPKGLFGALYRLYSRWIMPWMGGLLTRNRSAYTYLPKTASQFPAGERFIELMRSTGCFSEVSAIPLTFGLAYVYVGIVTARR